MIECMRNAACEHMTLDEQISFCEEKSKNIKLKAEPQTFVDIKNSLEKLKNPWIPVSERLPKKYGTYLVAWKPCGMSEGDIIKKCGKPHYYEMLEYDPDDEAQAMIAGMKFKTGDGRRLWHRVTESNGKKKYTQVANVSEIKAGAGDATAYEEFGCTIKWIKAPLEEGISK